MYFTVLASPATDSRQNILASSTSLQKFAHSNALF